MSSELLFRCKTDNAYHIKMIAEILSNIIKTGFFEINEKGIFLSMYDQPRKTLISVKLLAENFQIYKFNRSEPMYIGMNTSHFHKMLKSIKKKDSIELYIDNDRLSELVIKTTPREHSRTIISNIKIHTAQNLDIYDTPDGYKKSTIIPSGDFNKMIKDLNIVGSDKFIISSPKPGVITFSADSDGIIKREIAFGEEDCDLYEHTNVTSYASEQIERIAKIHSLSSSVYVYPPVDELPIQFKSAIGNIGTICIFVKSNEILNAEEEMSKNDGYLY